MASADQFLRDDNTVKWGALGMALAGSVLMAIWTGVITVTTAFGEAFAAFFGGLGWTIEFEASVFLARVTNLFRDAWIVPAEFGLFALPIRVVAVLTLFGLLAWLVITYADAE